MKYFLLCLVLSRLSLMRKNLQLMFVCHWQWHSTNQNYLPQHNKWRNKTILVELLLSFRVKETHWHSNLHPSVIMILLGESVVWRLFSGPWLNKEFLSSIRATWTIQSQCLSIEDKLQGYKVPYWVRDKEKMFQCPPRFESASSLISSINWRHWAFGNQNRVEKDESKIIFKKK